MLRAARGRWRDHAQRGAGSIDYHVGVAGTMTVDPVVPFLGEGLLDRGFYPAISVGPYNQIFQVCLEGEQAFDSPAGTRPLDALVLIWRIEDLVPAGGDVSRARDVLTDLCGAVDQLLAQFTGSVVVSVPPMPDDAYLGWRDLSYTHGIAAIHRAVVVDLMAFLADRPRVLALDLDLLQRAHGMVSASDPRKWLLYRQPWREAFWYAVGDRLARVLAAQHRAPKKCIIVDGDNTLWGGVVGEDGLAGIALGENFPGSAYVAFQRQLLHLQELGVLLALASKNDPEAVEEVLEKHDAMVLRADHFACRMVNWEPKSENVRRIAAQLNIGLDSLVFVDDSAYEVAEVTEACPRVTGLQVPEDAAYLPALLPTHAHLFDAAGRSEEDAQRTVMMAAAQAREAAREGLSREAFLASLDLRVRVFAAQPEHVVRVGQLINKTNQFNLTTRRRTEADVGALLSDEDVRVFALRARDRFGDYGLVGVGIAVREETFWTLDTFLLSCRILGRGVETAFLRVVADRLQAVGGDSLRGEYIPTDRNGLVATFLPDHGFTPSGDGWYAAWDGIATCPDHITLDS
jgi:FkbH-like protein